VEQGTTADLQSRGLDVSIRKKDENHDADGRRSRPTRDALNGTTRRVYRYIYRHGPVRLHEIQRELGLSSSSISDYHVQKLLRMGLIRQENGQDGVAGYVAEEAVFEAMIRVRRMVIPLWTTASAFFAAAIVVLITILRPVVISSTYAFSLLVAAVALSIAAYETFQSFSSDGL
jgi:predicted DNA-binding transcriptional regulator